MNDRPQKKIEKITIWTATYTDKELPNRGALDYIIEALAGDPFGAECIVFDMDAEDWTLKPSDTTVEQEI